MLQFPAHSTILQNQFNMKLNKNKKIKYFLRIYVIELRIANYELNSGRPLEILRSLGSINNRQTNAVEQLKKWVGYIQ